MNPAQFAQRRLEFVLRAEGLPARKRIRDRAVRIDLVVRLEAHVAERPTVLRDVEVAARLAVFVRVGLRSVLETDLVHPHEEAGEVLADEIEKWLPVRVVGDTRRSVDEVARVHDPSVL